ncbi:polyketide cyclase [Fulvimonas sp. R45]|uniref:polyketide cyclase n=1 Tax=Fulvimonas sp. R45 TaxID=3045937 RepID=UPI00265DD663|nr:polyketide cyclase [Fulvimonas sp. R45]MDO1529941.1 polyketide cyclase [Fulvimonas sp. R45]
MTRVLEIIVALIIVAVLGVVAGIAMPGSGHVERSLVLGKDLRQVYDVMDNLRRFPDYSVQRADDPRIQYAFSGPAYGPGAAVEWTSDVDKVGNGKLTIASAKPDFNKIDPSVNSAQIIWNLDNNWRGNDKHFTIDLERQGRQGKLTKVTWSYDVAYGFNLLSRYSNLYIHGAPDTLIQYSLNNLQNVLAAVPNVDYSDLVPYIVQTKPTPVLLVSASSPRKDGLAGLDEVVGNAVNQLNAAAKKLGVNVTGPRIIFTTNYGDETYSFDVALPIDATSLTVNGQSYALTAPTHPALSDDAAAESSSAPASGSSSAAAPALNPGDHDKFGRLVVDDKVRAALAFGGPALEGVWNGTAAGVPQTRDMLKAYAQTHGYKYDEVVDRLYDIEVQPEVQDAKGDITTYAKFDVYLPITDSANGGKLPEQTPEQAAGMPQPSLDANGNQAPASSGSAPAPAGSSAAPAAADSAQ